MSEESERAGEWAESLEEKSLGIDTKSLLEEYSEKIKSNKYGIHKERKELYDFVKSASVGNEVHCPGCGKSFTKQNNKQVYCKSAKKQNPPTCRDLFHNRIDERKREYGKEHFQK